LSKKTIELAKSVFDIEAQAILGLKERIGDSFIAAVDLIMGCKGKVVVTGIGKSGQIARKIASTLSSTGTPAVYLHPAESGHGDLGLISQQDVLIGISYGGDSSELIPILNYVARKNIPLIAMTGKMQGSLAKASSVVLDVSVHREACPLGLAPTASSTAALAMGDAIAMAVLDLRGFSADDFAQNHPGGGLGFKLSRVKDLMHQGTELPLVRLTTPMREVLSVMTHRDVRGAAGVCDESGDLVGIITDGGIRKKLETSDQPLHVIAKEVMTLSPRTIDCEELVEKALFMMEQFRINVLFVLDSKSSNPKRPVGIIHIQDLIKAKVR
jgi:arabinose-5-phosphate isomerase